MGRQHVDNADIVRFAQENVSPTTGYLKGIAWTEIGMAEDQ